jgi:hypothetical protein
VKESQRNLSREPGELEEFGSDGTGKASDDILIGYRMRMDVEYRLTCDQAPQTEQRAKPEVDALDLRRRQVW